jgi:hypothetical protein
MARKESHGSPFPDTEIRFGMNVGKELKVKWCIKKRLVWEGQSGWDRRKVGIRTAGSGVEENEDSRAFAVNNPFNIAGSLLWTGSPMSAGLFLSAGDLHQICAWGVEWDNLRHVRWTPILLAKVIASAEQGAPRYSRDFCRPHFDKLVDRD